MQSSTDSPPSHADPDRRADRRRQGLRQQRLLGHLPDRLGGLLAVRPAQAGELVDGFVQQYRDGGWIARWSSPGYANLMTGTSSDVAFADAYVKGVKGFDATRRLRRGAQERHRRAAGRHPNDPTSAARAWRRRCSSATRRSRCPRASRGRSRATSTTSASATWRRRWPAARAAPTGSVCERSPSTSSAARTDYVNMFDPAIGFFQGRSASGRWKSSPDEYDPRVWGHEHDYTETDGWNFAFHVPQDGQGLANLYGGRAALARKLDAFFATPGDRDVHGLLRRDDPRDARGARRAHGAVGLLEPGLAPHPVHVRLRGAAVRRPQANDRARRCAGCTPAARSARATRATRTTARRPPGTCSAPLGLYPLQMGSPNYAIGSPLFKKPTIHRPGRGHRRQRAEQQHAQRVRAGSAGQRPALEQDVPAALDARQRRHARRSTWARGRPAGRPSGDTAPPSLTEGREPARPLRDATGKHGGEATSSTGNDVSKLFDDSSATRGRDRRVGRVRVRPAARRALLHADVGRVGGRGPERAGR